MAARDRKKSVHELHRELVPLAEAAAVAYHVIAERPMPLKDPGALADIRGRVAVALSSVSTVLRQENGAAIPLSAAESKERLFASGRRPDLAGLCMRRVDLLRAIELLRDAHVAFDPPQVPESLRRR